ncbi:MAG: hypothetical protein KAH12_03470, partial [Anaerolineales bacterium]|nr:hypothetical protein [Anaerolineales bacterium]
MMFRLTRRIFIGLFLTVLLAGSAAASGIENGDFETGDLTGWTKFSTAFNANPSTSDGGGLFSGWNNDWYVNSYFADETATGLLRSDTFELTGQIIFRIAGWNYWPGVGTEFDYNYVVLKKASDHSELARVWAPNQNNMVSRSLRAPANIGDDVFIEVTDNASVTDYAWLAVDAFWMDDPARASDPDPGDRELAADVVLSWTNGNTAVEHDVYFGADLASVREANTSDTTGIYRGRQTPDSYDPCTLDEETTYYWRIDEVDSVETIVKGDVWSFRLKRDLYSDTWIATDAID